MAILKIARMGHPVLARRAEPVDDPTHPDIRRLVADMRHTLADIGGAGLAAPQVHVPLRVVIFEVPPDADADPDRQEQEQGRERPEMAVLVNPEVEPLGDETAVDWEGCLSLPGLRGAVPRPSRVRYRALGLAGETIAREADGFHARVVQHECDHLDGILYPMRMTDMASLHFVSEMARNPRLLAAPGAGDAGG